MSLQFAVTGMDHRVLKWGTSVDRISCDVSLLIQNAL